MRGRVEKRVFMSECASAVRELQTAFNSNDVLPLRSVPRTGCVGHCGNLRLKRGRKEKESASVSWLFRKSEMTHSELPSLVLWTRGSR